MNWLMEKGEKVGVKRRKYNKFKCEEVFCELLLFIDLVTKQQKIRVFQTFSEIRAEVRAHYFNSDLK